MTVPASPLVDLDTVADLTAYLALQPDVATPSADTLQLLLTAISARIQSYTSRNFVSQPYSVVLDGRGSDRIDLPNTPITAVQSLAVDGVAIAAAASPTQSGYVFSAQQVLLRGYRFCRGVQNVALTYTGGFVAIPSDIVQAVREGVTVGVRALERDPALLSIKAGDTAFDYGRDLEALARLCLTPNITSALNQVSRVVPC